MQSQLKRFCAVSLIAVTLAGAVLVGESSAQWGRFAQPYYVNYDANFYPAGYLAWRPFGGLFAGIHGMLCHRCWHSPCCCVTPMICDPCYDPCDPCGDFCCNSCGFAAGSCGCTDQFGYGYYDQPRSLSVGTPSLTGFGSVSPSEGVPGQRPVGTPSSQRPAYPSTLRTQQTPFPDTSPRTFTPSIDQPTLAPTQPSDGTALDPAIDPVESRLNEIPRRDPYVQGSFSGNLGGNQPFRSSDADTPPTTGGIDRGWIDNNNSTTNDGFQSAPDSTTTPGGGQLPMPQGMGTETQPGGSSTNNLKLDLGSGAISVTVPESAKVYINGYETRMTGINRRYVVNDLEPGMQYDYEVRIVTQVNGRTVEETQLVTLSSGQQGMVAFGKPQSGNGNNAYLAARPVQ